jgi:hypothetical protein
LPFLVAELLLRNRLQKPFLFGSAMLQASPVDDSFSDALCVRLFSSFGSSGCPTCAHPWIFG